MLKAAIYARFSTDMQDSATIATQIAECTRKAQALGAVVVAAYADEAQSGKTDDRENFRLMLADAKKKNWEIVIVRKYDRFARNVIDARMTEAHLEKYGVKLVSVFENFDDSTPAGWMGKQMMHLVNEWYSRNVATETKSGMETNTLKGFRCGGTAPVGYRNVKVTDQATGKTRTVLEIDEREAEAVRLIFKRYAEGVGHNRIINELLEFGMRPRRSKTWNKSQLSQMLQNETYRGVLTWRKTPDRKTWVRKEGAVPELIDEETWLKVQARQLRNRDAAARTNEVSSHPLSGLVFCGICGNRFITAQKNDGKWKLSCGARRFKRVECSNQRTVDETALVEEVKRLMLDRLYTRENIARGLDDLRAQLQADRKNPESDLALVRRQIAVNESKQARLVEELSLGELPRAAIAAGLERLETEMKTLADRAADLQKQVDELSDLRVTERDIEDFCSLAREAISNASGERLREELQRLGVRIEIGADSAKIEIAPPVLGDANPLSAGSPRRYTFTSLTFPIPRANQPQIRRGVVAAGQQVSQV